MNTDPSSDLIIKRSELPKYLKKYNCENQRELDKYLWFECGVALTVLDD